MDYQVLEVLDGDRAIVSTRGLARVVIDGRDEPIAELLPRDEADLCAQAYNGCFRGPERAHVAEYKPAPVAIGGGV